MRVVLEEGLVMRRIAEAFGVILHITLVSAFIVVGFYWMFVVLTSEAIRARGGLWIVPVPFVLGVMSHFAIGWIRRRQKRN